MAPEECSKHRQSPADITGERAESLADNATGVRAERVKNVLDNSLAKRLYALLHTLMRRENFTRSAFSDIPFGTHSARMLVCEIGHTKMLLSFSLPGDSHIRREIIIGLDGIIEDGRVRGDEEIERVTFGREEPGFDSMSMESLIAGTLEYLDQPNFKLRTREERLASLIERLRTRSGFPDSDVRIVSGMPRENEIGWSELAIFDPDMDDANETSFLVRTIIEILADRSLVFPASFAQIVRAIGQRRGAYDPSHRETMRLRKIIMGMTEAGLLHTDERDRMMFVKTSRLSFS